MPNPILASLWLIGQCCRMLPCEMKNQNTKNLKMVCVALITKWTKWKLEICVWCLLVLVHWTTGFMLTAPTMPSNLTIAIVAVFNKRPFGANSNTEGPAFCRADSRWRGAIWGTSEAHHCTAIHSNRVISSHAHYNLGQAEAKSEAVFIKGDVTGRARVKFVYHVTFQDDSYKLRMAWSLYLVGEKDAC